jgi:hypothetical protein
MITADGGGRRGTLIARNLQQRRHLFGSSSLTGSKLTLNEDIFVLFDPE